MYRHGHFSLPHVWIINWFRCPWPLEAPAGPAASPPVAAPAAPAAARAAQAAPAAPAAVAAPVAAPVMALECSITWSSIVLIIDSVSFLSVFNSFLSISFFF